MRSSQYPQGFQYQRGKKYSPPGP